jgi:hypothetical protein
MNVKRVNLVCALGLLVVSVLACKFSFTTANISGLKIGKDRDVSTTVSSFAPKDTVYVVADVSNAPSKMKLKARLLIDSVEGFSSGTLVPGAETTIDLPGSSTGTFTFTPPTNGWPNGSYKVEVNMLNEDGEQKDQKTSTFSVSGNTTSKTTTTATTESSNTQGPATGAEKDGAASGGNSVAGIWTFSGEGTSGTPLTLGPWELSLDEKGTELAGEIDGGDGSPITVSGSRRGDNLTLTWGSGAAQFNLTGTMDRNGNMSGDFTQSAGAHGKWQARKSS